MISATVLAVLIPLVVHWVGAVIVGPSLWP
jgi:hypothetical protein